MKTPNSELVAYVEFRIAGHPLRGLVSRAGQRLAAVEIARALEGTELERRIRAEWRDADPGKYQP